MTAAKGLEELRKLCANMAAPIREMVNESTEDCYAVEIYLQDWPCLDWDNYDGRSTLTCDPAHPMSIYTLTSLKRVIWKASPGSG